MPADFNPLALLNYAKWAVLSCGLAYILLAFGLSLLGARVRQRSTWLAWLPVLNFYLMCRLARSSLLLILPALIPGLNFLVFAYLGARMAKRVGRSGFLGALFGVPVLGNVVPLVLGLGRPTEEEKAAPAPAQPPLVTALIHAGVMLSLLVLTGGGFMAASRMSRPAETTVQQAVAPLPKRVAGMLTEFPIDTATANPARPSGVASERYAKPVLTGANPKAAIVETKSGPSGMLTAPPPPQSEAEPGEVVTKEHLPPWLTPRIIAGLAESATTAEYLTANGGERVRVVTLALREEGAGELKPPTPEELALIAPNATVSGVELQSADKAAYRGFRVRTANSTYFVLRRKDSPTAVLISAGDAASIPLAERLAANVGNGQGLFESEEYRSAFSQVPPPPPGGSLFRLQTYTESDIAANVAKVNAGLAAAKAAGKDLGPEAAAIIPLAMQLVPRSFSTGIYKAEDDRKFYIAAVAGYSSKSNAWTAVQALRAMEKLIPSGQHYTVVSMEVGGLPALVVDGTVSDGGPEDGMPYSGVLLRRNGALAALASMGFTSKELMPWVESYAKAP